MRTTRFTLVALAAAWSVWLPAASAQGGVAEEAFSSPRPHHQRSRRARLPLPLDRAHSPSSSPSHLDLDVELDRRFGAVDLEDPLYLYDDEEETRAREVKERVARLAREKVEGPVRMERRSRSGKRQLGEIEGMVDDAVGGTGAAGQAAAVPTTPPAGAVNSVSTAQGGFAGTFPNDALATAPGAVSSAPYAASSPTASSAPHLETVTLSSSSALPTDALATSPGPGSPPSPNSAPSSTSPLSGASGGSTQIASSGAIVSTGLLTSASSAASLPLSSPSSALPSISDAEANAAAAATSSSPSRAAQTNARGATVTRFSTAPAATVSATGLAQERGAGGEGNGAASGALSSLAGGRGGVMAVGVAVGLFLL